MPNGPKGEKRPADVIGNAVKVMRIATGEESENISDRRGQRASVARLRATPAIAAGLSKTVMDWANIVEAMDADTPPEKRGAYKTKDVS